jgi:hypothetical protein
MKGKMGAALIAAALALVSVAPARAEEVVTTRRDEPTTMGIIGRDTLWGGVAGAAVGGGIVLIENGGFTMKHGNNWGRTLALSTGIGLIAGVGFGIFDAATMRQETTVTTPRAATDGYSSQDRIGPDASGVAALSAPALRW